MAKKVSTVLSALIWRPGPKGGEVLVKDATRGLSLLGSDQIEWGLGAVTGLTKRLFQQHEILVHPTAINGIYSGMSPSGKSIAANINFCAELQIPSKNQHLHWISREQIIAGKYPVNTPDLIQSLTDLETSPRASLDFVNSPVINEFISSGEARPEEITACSVVVYNPLVDKVLFVVRGDGCYSLPGGKIENSDLLGELDREAQEEIGRPLRKNLRGLIAAITKRTPSGRYVTSVPTFAVVHDEDFSNEGPAKIEGEIKKLQWLSPEALESLGYDKFYTPDTYVVARVSVERYKRGTKFTPLEILRQVA
jgi:8-oxo-dGTP pyrophosphatase MutT (NUDIX family)